MASLHLLTQCDSFNEKIDPPDEIIDDSGVKAASGIIEDAFLQGDKDAIIENLLPEAVEYYTGILESTSVDNLIAFGEAFKDRDLDILSELYAEYSFTIGGRDYTVTFALQDGDKWVLSRF